MPFFDQNTTCAEKLIELANHFGDYGGEIGSMVYNSGWDLNDLGRFESCSANNFSRYISFATQGLPIGVFLGICGPAECTEDDYQSTRGKLAEFGNDIIRKLDINVTLLNINLTENSFSFVDSKWQNEIDKQITTPFIIACIFFGFFGISCLIGTGFELYNNHIEEKLKLLEKSADGFISPENI